MTLLSPQNHTSSPPAHPASPSVPDGNTLAGQSRWLHPLPWFALTFALRLALLPTNHAEYTDGLLQLEALARPVGLYPPLYGLLAILPQFLGLSAEYSGRFISALASAFIVFPLWSLVRLAGGSPRAAGLAAVLLLTSPLINRWGIRVMTDSLFLLLSTSALTAWCHAWRRLSLPASAPSGPLLFILGTALAVAATLTRYQGLALGLLSLPLLLTIFRKLPSPSATKAATALLLWLLVPAASLLTGFAHSGQFTSRTTPHLLSTLAAYWNTAESFVLISPYFFGYPLVALALYQLIRWGVGTFPHPGLAMWLAWIAILLLAHSAFQSFQYRYAMPALPLVILLAALALDNLFRQSSPKSRRTAFILTVITVLWLTGQSAAILILQRGTFGDQREAAQWAGANLPPELPLFSNERYGNYTEFGSLKMSQWANRPVQILSHPDDLPNQRSVVILSNAYGGDEVMGAFAQALQARFIVRPVFAAERTIIPLHDDVMVSPQLNQNPLGWVLRYVPQRFRTQVLLLEPRP